MDIDNNLCMLCRELNIATIADADHGGYEHHKTLAALETAAKGGCRLCTLFLWSTLNQYTAAEGMPTGSDVKYLDYEEIESFYGVEAAMNVRWWNAPRAPGWSPEKTMDYHRCLDRKAAYGFNVKPTFITFAQDSYGQPHLRTEGCNGLHYSRGKSSMETGSLPRFQDKADRQVAPWLSMSVLEGDTGNIIGRSLSSDFDKTLCERWLSECTGSHASCKSMQATALPTRVIDVLDPAPSCMVRLVEPQAIEDQYIALSYCWGSSRPFSTTTSTLQAHLAGIEICHMPGLYQDAIKVCRMLEIRYLWIDSLCIIQDDETDWQRECALMDKVYENAAFTINVPAASDTTYRFLTQRPVPSTEPCTLSVFWPSTATHEKVQVAAAHSPSLAYAGEETNGPSRRERG